MDDIPYEPRRHSAGPRNRKKALKHAVREQEELEFIHAVAIRLLTNYRYAIGRNTRLVNRLTAEVEADEK